MLNQLSIGLKLTQILGTKLSVNDIKQLIIKHSIYLYL